MHNLKHTDGQSHPIPFPSLSPLFRFSLTIHICPFSGYSPSLPSPSRPVPFVRALTAPDCPSSVSSPALSPKPPLLDPIRLDSTHPSRLEHDFPNPTQTHYTRSPAQSRSKLTLMPSKAQAHASHRPHNGYPLFFSLFFQFLLPLPLSLSLSFLPLLLSFFSSLSPRSLAQRRAPNPFSHFNSNSSISSQSSRPSPVQSSLVRSALSTLCSLHVQLYFLFSSLLLLFSSLLLSSPLLSFLLLVACLPAAFPGAIFHSRSFTVDFSLFTVHT